MHPFALKFEALKSLRLRDDSGRKSAPLGKKWNFRLTYETLEIYWAVKATLSNNEIFIVFGEKRACFAKERVFDFEDDLGL